MFKKLILTTGLLTLFLFPATSFAETDAIEAAETQLATRETERNILREDFDKARTEYEKAREEFDANPGDDNLAIKMTKAREKADAIYKEISEDLEKAEEAIKAAQQELERAKGQAFTTIEPSYRPINMPLGLGAEFTGQNLKPVQIFVLILQIIAGGLLYFAAPIAVIMLVLASSMLIIGGSETEKVDQAKKNITWIIVGLLAIIFSYSIVRILIELILRVASG
jgi:outer membrane murein-binding lipoprotein Lpp